MACMTYSSSVGVRRRGGALGGHGWARPWRRRVELRAGLRPPMMFPFLREQTVELRLYASAEQFDVVHADFVRQVAELKQIHHVAAVQRHAIIANLVGAL